MRFSKKENNKNEKVAIICSLTGIVSFFVFSTFQFFCYNNGNSVWWSIINFISLFFSYSTVSIYSLFYRRLLLSIWLCKRNIIHLFVRNSSAIWFFFRFIHQSNRSENKRFILEYTYINYNCVEFNSIWLLGTQMNCHIKNTLLKHNRFS